MQVSASVLNETLLYLRKYSVCVTLESDAKWIIPEVTKINIRNKES